MARFLPGQEDQGHDHRHGLLMRSVVGICEDTSPLWERGGGDDTVSLVGRCMVRGGADGGSSSASAATASQLTATHLHSRERRLRWLARILSTSSRPRSRHPHLSFRCSRFCESHIEGAGELSDNRKVVQVHRPSIRPFKGLPSRLRHFVERTSKGLGSSRLHCLNESEEMERAEE